MHLILEILEDAAHHPVLAALRQRVALRLDQAAQRHLFFSRSSSASAIRGINRLSCKNLSRTILTPVRNFLYPLKGLTSIPFRKHPLNCSEVNIQARLYDMHDEALRKALGSRLKALRKQRHLAQKELAALVDIRFQQLNKYESGFNTPPAEMLVKLAAALGVTVDFLLTGNPVEDSPLANTRLFRRFKVLEALAQDDQETVIKVIDAMIAKQRVTFALAPLDAVA